MPQTAEQYILSVIRKGSANSTMADGRKQIQQDVSGLCRDWCRYDAVGRMSKADVLEIRAAITELNKRGILDGEMNGYPLLAKNSHVALRKLGT